MPRLFCVVLLLLSLFFLSRPVSAQNVDMKQLFSGSGPPLTLEMKDLDTSWRRFFVADLSRHTDEVQFYVAALQGIELGVYYTRGETTTLGSDLFLVAYRPQPRKVDFQTQANLDSSTPKILQPETHLGLCLLNLRFVGSMNDIRPFSLEDETKNPAALAAELAPTEPPTQPGHNSADNPDLASTENLGRIGHALIEYTADYDEALPPMKTAAQSDEAIYPYLKDRSLFEHPGTHELYQVNTSLSHRTLASFKDPATMVVYFEASPGTDGLRAVQFLDGHVVRVDEAKWQKLKVASHIPNPATPKK